MIRSVLIVLLFITSSYSIAQQDKLNAVSFDFRYFKYRNTTYTIDYLKKELSCSMFGFRGTTDTLFHRTYTFTDSDFKKLRTELNLNIPESHIKKGEDAMDGGGFTISYLKNNGESSRLELTNPISKSSKFNTELKKIDMFFDFAYHIVKDSLGIQTLDHSYAPFFRGLPVRKISNQPLEYKIWGSINSDIANNPKLTAFLDALPKNQCVIIDCANNLSYSLQEGILERYIIKNSNQYYINNNALEWLRPELYKARDSIKLSKKAAKTKNSNAYTLYSNNPNEMDKWLDRPYITARSINAIRKKCQ